jgi:PAS domain S-box-containing protein
MSHESPERASGTEPAASEFENVPVHQLMATIVESTDDAVVTKNLNGTILSWNRAAERMLGYTAAETIGRHISMLVPAEWSREPDQVLERIRACEPVRHYETIRVHKNGRPVHVSLTVSPLHNRTGAVLGASIIARDITARVAAATTIAEQERRFIVAFENMNAENERQLRTVFENTTLLARISDLDGKIVHCNDALAELAQLPSSKVIGRNWFELFGSYPEDEQFYSQLENDVVLPFYEGRAQARGEDLVIAWTNVDLRDENGMLYMVASLGDNITARRATEHALERARTERKELIAAILAAENAERTRLAQALHDDTIQVMTAAKMTVDMAAKRLTSAQLAQASEALGLAIQRARLLMFELHPPLQDEHGLAEAIDRLCHRASIDAGFSVSVDVCAERLPTSVEELVFRTVREAVINARRHSQASHLQVTVARQGGWIEGRVSDDGVGFDPVAVRGRRDSELHLGLTALADRLRLVEGSLTVESRPSQGTTIRFYLPAA